MWRVSWPLADSFTLLVYSWALDPGLWNKKTLCSPLNGIRHGLPKGPPWSLAWRVQTLSRKQSENVCEEMMDKYCYICIYIYMFVYIYNTYLVDFLAEYYLLNFMHAVYCANVSHCWLCMHMQTPRVYLLVKTPQKANS